MLNGKVIKLILAVSVNPDGRFVIGKDRKIPWMGMLPSDMRRFKDLTVGHSVIMGRKTWESLDPKFRPLPKRENIVITRQFSFNCEAFVAHSLDEAVRIAGSQEVWVMGGAEIYELALPHADFMHVTSVHGRFNGDAFLRPNFFTWDNWEQTSGTPLTAGVGAAEKDKINSDYWVFQKKK